MGRIKSTPKLLILFLFILAVGVALYIYIFGKQNSLPAVDFTVGYTAEPYRAEMQTKALKIAMISILNREETYRYQRQLVKAVAEKMGRSPLLVQRASYAEIVQLLESGSVDAALLSTGAYAAYGKGRGFTPLVMQQRSGSALYHGLIIVPANSKAATLMDLKGKSFAFTDPLSYSGHLSVLRMLKEKGENPNTFFGSSHFTLSHDKTLRAVSKNFFDGGSITTLVYDYYSKKQPEMLKDIRILAELPSAGTGPLIVRSSYSEKEKLKAVLLSLHEDPEAAAAMNELLIDRFVETNEHYYPLLD